MSDFNYKAISLVEKKTSTYYFFLADSCLYASYSKRGDIIYVKCIDENCNCNGKISDGQFTRTNDIAHIHEDNHLEVANYHVAYEKLRALVKTDRRPLRVLHQEVLVTLSRDAAGMLAWRHCHRSLERIRNDFFPPCGSLAEFQESLEDEESYGFKSYGCIRGNKFYQGSLSGQLVFANLELIGELGQELDLFVDATFGVTPFHSRQLLVILAELKGKPRPLVYVVMHGQTTVEYAEIFKFCRDAVFGFDGEERTVVSATCDFEKAIRGALIQAWQNIEIYGCNFHYCQALKRQARSFEGLSASLLASELHIQVLTMFTRLSLLPLERIMTGFGALLQFIIEKDLEEDFRDFVEYFRRTWFVRYDIKDWCVSDRERRTNNNLEGYNNRLKQQIPAHPKPWIFVDALRKLAFDATSEHDSEVLDDAPPPIDRSTLTEPLNAALRELRAGTIDELGFLKRLSLRQRT